MAADTPLVLVDGSSYLFRAFHALPDLRTTDGFPTGAIRGVIGMLRKLQADFAGSTIVVVFDASGPTFRHTLYTDYKANRPRMADDLRTQIQPILDIVQAMGMPLLTVPEVEADDVIGTLATAAAKAQRRTVVSTGDKDLAQLVDAHVTLVDTMSGATLDEAGVEAKFGVRPAQIVDYLALMGDATDNIPGVPKVGPKTAAKWLAQYGSLDGVMAHASEVKGKVGENLRASLAQLPLARSLTTIRCDVALPLGLADLVAEPPDEDVLRGHFERYEFKPWLEALGAVPPPPPPEATPCAVATATTLEALQPTLDAALETGQLALRLETAGSRFMAAEVIGIALAVHPGEAVYIPVGHDYVGAPAQLRWQDFLDAAKPVLESPAVAKIGQDLKTVQNVLSRHGVALAGVESDTMLQSYVLDSVGARRHQLEDVAAKYLQVQAPDLAAIAGKGAKRLPANALPIAALANHAGQSVDIAGRLAATLRPKLEAAGRLAAVYDELDKPLVGVLSRMECRGTLVDRALLQTHSEELAARLTALAEQTVAEAGREFNLGSTKQLQEVLYDELELPVLKKTQKGQRSTEESVLLDLADRGHELPRLILEHRTLAKLKSTYTDALPAEINPRTGRIHTSYNQAVAATGRLSSADPNLQNIPIRTPEGRRIRQAFVAPPGKKLLAADYSQIELRIMAHLSGDRGLLDAFARGEDVHRATAAEVFDVGLEAVSAEQRRSAKAINFGLIYGMSAFGLAKQIGVSRHVARGYMARYFARYPGVADYMERVRAGARADGFVETVFGRRLYLPELAARSGMRRQAAERAAINAPMQGSAADIIKLAMLAIDEFAREASLDVAMVMQVHDELVLEVATEDVPAVVAEARKRMSNAAALAVELVVDVGVGDNWDEAH